MTLNGDGGDNVMKILIASDTHLGYNENDSIRGKDSFIAFEEVLQCAQEYDVDFILLAGDLFHEARPSPNCMLKCSTLFRKYCLGSRPVAIEILSDQSENFKESINATVNYEDPNLNVSFPVFSIHGNHDDPIGEDSISPLDILSRMGLVNYFGKWSDFSHLTVSPILMQKGTTKVALYGISHLKDMRLARLFRDGKVIMETAGNTEEWFNILTLHQNRADRGVLNYISEDVLPDILDLVVWGHEHDCKIVPKWNEKKNFHVTQPGSSVATSLANGESLTKHIGLFTVRGKTFKPHYIPLRTVRPFLFDSLVLSEHNLNRTVNQHEIVQKFISNKIEEMLIKVQDQITGHSEQPTLPLLRLCVQFEHDNQQFNSIRFGQQFSDRVANPQDMIMLKREKIRDRKVDNLNIDREGLANAIKAQIEEISVESLLEKHYKNKPENEQLRALSVPWLGDAVRSFTQKNEDRAIEVIVNAHKKKYMEHLMKTNVTLEDDVLEQISICKLELFTEQSDERNKILENLEDTLKTTGRQTVDASSDDSEDVDEPLIKSPSNSTIARGRGRGRGSRGGRGATKVATQSKSKIQATLDISTSNPPVPKTTSASSTNWLTNITSTRTRKPSAKVQAAQVIYDSDSE